MIFFSSCKDPIPIVGTTFVIKEKKVKVSFDSYYFIHNNIEFRKNSNDKGSIVYSLNKGKDVAQVNHKGQITFSDTIPIGTEVVVTITKKEVAGKYKLYQASFTIEITKTKRVVLVVNGQPKTVVKYKDYKNSLYDVKKHFGTKVYGTKTNVKKENIHIKYKIIIGDKIASFNKTSTERFMLTIKGAGTIKIKSEILDTERYLGSSAEITLIVKYDLHKPSLDILKTQWGNLISIPKEAGNDYFLKMKNGGAVPTEVNFDKNVEPMQLTSTKAVRGIVVVARIEASTKDSDEIEFTKQEGKKIIVNKSTGTVGKNEEKIYRANNNKYNFDEKFTVESTSPEDKGKITYSVKNIDGSVTDIASIPNATNPEVTFHKVGVVKIIAKKAEILDKYEAQEIQFILEIKPAMYVLFYDFSTNNNVLRLSLDGSKSTSIGRASSLYQGAYALVFKDKIWISGGRAIISGPQNILISSSTGIKWNDVTLSKAYTGRNEHSMVIFNDKMWIIGGANRTGRLNDVWRTTADDMTKWEQVTNNAEFSKRSGHQSLVFMDPADNKEKIWVLGGDSGGLTDLNDVWKSEDGVTWTKVLSDKNIPSNRRSQATQFSRRTKHSALVFNNEIWIIGGQGKKDVWSSSDGASWKKKNFTFQNDLFPNVIVYNSKMWVIDKSYNIWNSSDGINWNNAGTLTLRNGIGTLLFVTF